MKLPDESSQTIADKVETMLRYDSVQSPRFEISFNRSQLITSNGLLNR